MSALTTENQAQKLEALTMPSEHRPMVPKQQQNSNKSHCDLSIIIPVLNEEHNIEPLCTELFPVLDETGLDYEVIFVDDGSKDHSLAQLRNQTQDNPRVTLIEFRRNFGQTPAMAAGIDYSCGDVIIPMDADLQNDPHDIPRLLTKLQEKPDHDIVSGWRRDRKDKFMTRRIPSQIANKIISKVTGVSIHDFGCTLKAYKRNALAGVDLYSELHRFLPALAAWNGASIVEIEVNHRPRIHGQTKYGLRRSTKVLLDLVTVKFLGTYMTKPLYFFGKVGIWAMVASIITLGLAIGQKYGYFWQPNGIHLNRNVMVPMSALLFFLSVQSILFGVLAELLVRIYHGTRQQPTYRVRNVYRSPSKSANPSSDRPTANQD